MSYYDSLPDALKENRIKAEKVSRSCEFNIGRKWQIQGRQSARKETFHL